jgi:hypothetical protein
MDCGRLTLGRLLGAAVIVVALGLLTAAPVGAIGNPNLEKLILTDPVPGWANSTPNLHLPTAQAETLYYATEYWRSPDQLDLLTITLLDDPAYPFPKAEDLAHVVCGSGAVVLTETSVKGLADSIEVTCQSAAGVQSAVIVWRQGIYLPEVRVSPTASLGVTRLESVALSQDAAIAAAPAAGSSGSTSALHRPLVLVGLGLIVVLVVVLVVLLRRDRRRTAAYPVIDGPPPGDPLGGPPSAPPAPVMPSAVAVNSLVNQAPVAANGELPPFAGQRAPGPVVDSPADQPVPAAVGAGRAPGATPVPLARLSMDEDLPPFSAVRAAGAADGPGPATDPPPTANGTPAPVAPPAPDPVGAAPPGWHRDPRDGTVLAYWDGQAWTGRRRWDGRAWVDVV